MTWQWTEKKSLRVYQSGSVVIGLQLQVGFQNGCIQQGSSVSAQIQDTYEPVCIWDSTSVLGNNHCCYCLHVFLHIPGLGHAKGILLFIFYDTCTGITFGIVSEKK
jgi:hypothetical protein